MASYQWSRDYVASLIDRYDRANEKGFSAVLRKEDREALVQLLHDLENIEALAYRKAFNHLKPKP